MSMTLNDRSVVRLLETKNVEVSIGEPWNFESSAGQNRLEATVLSVEIGKSNGNGKEDPEQSVLLEVTPFESETGETVTQLVARARYTDDVAEFVKKLADGEAVSSNLSYSEQVKREDMPEGVSPFLIGSIRLS